MCFSLEVDSVRINRIYVSLINSANQSPLQLTSGFASLNNTSCGYMFDVGYRVVRVYYTGENEVGFD